ncbi:hypothetical protein BGX34_009201 [Mortierella sp. NVP85]|nr:hypothetical protein BGX34_009201 [Mortierella sp. NVP85]
MPSLNEKIFLPISIFVLNVVFAVFKFVLVSAVAASFAIYAKYGGEYANSVRWVRSAGYLELFHTLRNTHSRKTVPRSVKWAIVLAFFATLAASFLDKGIAVFVKPATRSGTKSTAVRVSQQYLPASKQTMFLGWNVAVPQGATVRKTMEATLAGPIANPNLVPGQIYEPVHSDYKATCLDFGFKFQDFILRNDTGCGAITPHFLTVSELPQYGLTQRSSNRWSLTMEARPGQGTYNLLDSPLGLSYQIVNAQSQNFSDCYLYESYRHRGPLDMSHDVTAFPKTSTTKCFHDNGGITALSVTTTRFAHLDPSYDFESVDKIFANESNELLLSMNETLANMTMTTDPGQSQNVTSFAWVELRLTNSTVDLYACGTSVGLSLGESKPAEEEIVSTYECIYAIISVVQFTKEVDGDIRKARGDKSFVTTRSSDTETTITNYITLEYPPTIKGSKAAPISIKNMTEDNLSVVDYMARLGYNFYADFADEKLYVMYNYADVLTGLEVPFWVLVIAGIILIISFAIWQYTFWLLSTPHNSSVYSIIRNRIAAKSNTQVPKLMRFQFEPLMFEGVKLLPEHIESFPEDVKVDVNPDDHY